MGILDDIQQLQMQRVQQAAQQQGFDQSGGTVQPAPEPPQQSQSQVGNSFPASAAPQPQQPTPDQSPDSGQAGRLQAGMADYANMLLKQAAQLSQHKPQSAWQRARQGFSDAGMHYVGLPTQREQNLQNMGVQDQALKTAVGVQQTGLQSQMVTLPNGLTVPLALAKTMAPALFRAQQSDTNNQRNNDTKKLLAGYNEDGSVKPLSSLSVPQQLKASASSALSLLNKARTDALNADPNTSAGRASLAKLQILEQNARANLSRAASAAGMESIAAQKFAADYINGMQDDEGNPIGLNQYKAVTNGDKAPAAMLQSAEYARGALGQADAADAAIERLKAHGVLGNFAKNKVEDLIFSNGAVDPSLSPEDRKDIGVARAAYGYESTGAMRAHTGRSAKEIYADFKNRLGMGQDLEALSGAQQQTRKLLTDYGNQATRKNIHTLRNNPIGGSNQSDNSGVITLTDGGKSYKIPAALKANFLKDHPNAR